MGRCCAGTGARPTALDRDDRFRPADSPGDPGELARISERFEVEQDHVGSGVGFPVVEEIVSRDVCLVAHRDETGEPAIEIWTRRLLNKQHGGQVAEINAVGEATRQGLAGVWQLDNYGGGLCLH